MITNINSYSFEEACTVLDGQFEHSSAIATIITEKIPDFKMTIKTMAYLIKLIIKQNESDDDEDQEIHIFDPYVIEQLEKFLTYLPIWLLRHDYIDWTEFLSAYMVLFENYIAIQEDLIPMIMSDREEDIRNAHIYLTELKELYSASEKLAGMTIGYRDLIRASSKMVEEMLRYNDASPTSYRLSKLYIDSINESIRKKEEKKC